MHYFIFSKYFWFFSLLFLILLIYYILKVRLKKRKLKKYKNVDLFKKKVKEHGVKDKQCQLHVALDMLTSYGKVIDNYFNEYEIFELFEDINVALSRGKLILFLRYSQIKHLPTLESKLGFKFYSLTFHYNIDVDFSYVEVEKAISNLNSFVFYKQIEKVVFSLNSNNSDELISDYNKIIGDNHILDMAMAKESVRDNLILALVNKTVTSTKVDINSKCFIVKSLNRIDHLIGKFHLDLETIPKQVFVSIQVNKNHYLHNKNHESRLPAFINLSTSLYVLINSILLSFFLMFIANIITEVSLNNKGKKAYSKILYNKNSPKKFDNIFKNSKSNIDQSLWVSWLYPEFIKYKNLNTIYSDVIADKILLPRIIRTKDVTELTAYLIYMTYLDNNRDADGIISIVSNLSGISEDNLYYIMEYSTKKVRKNLSSSVELYINRLIDTGGILFKDRYNIVSRFTTFNEDNIDISSQNRMQNLYSQYQTFVSVCKLDNYLNKALTTLQVKDSSKELFQLYQDYFSNTQEEVCNSDVIKTIVNNMSTILNIEQQNYSDIHDFSMAYQAVKSTLNILQRHNIQSLGEDDAYVNNLKKGLVLYSINHIINSSYNNKYMPLFYPLSSKFYMSFKLNFYNKAKKISPQYSKHFMKDSVVGIEENFNSLLFNLKKVYNVTPKFMINIFKDSITNYQNNYINSYKKIMMAFSKSNDLEQNVYNKKTLMLYIDAVSSDGSSINNWIKYYKKNTSFTDDGIIKKFSIISNHFEADNIYLNSEDYKNYKKAFVDLKKEIRSIGYLKTYEKVKKGYKSVNIAYDTLLPISKTNTGLYFFLKNHLDIAIRTIEKIAIKEAIGSLNSTNIKSDYGYIKNYLPFNLNARKTISDKNLINAIGNKGNIYVKLVKYLKPILKYNKDKKLWYNKAISTHEGLDYLAMFNKVYETNKILWDKEGVPKKIKFEFLPIINDENNYLFSSILFSNKSFVNSLDVNYIRYIPLKYNWVDEESITFLIKLFNNETVERNYSGNWSILKILKNAEYQNGIYTWKLKHVNESYPISFKIKSRLLDIMSKTQGE